MKWLLAPLLLSTSLLQADPTRGEVIYNQLCFTCHGPNLEGGIGPSLTDAYWHHGSSPEAIFDVINHGVEGSEMIGYKEVFPEADRLSLRDFLLLKQEGVREMERSIYPPEFFKDKRLAPDPFKTVESTSQTLLPENWIYMERNAIGVIRVTAKVHIRKAGSYHFSIRRLGRTAVYFQGKEVHYSDAKAPKDQDLNKPIHLEPGVYSFEILHDEPKSHSYRFHGTLNGPAGTRFPLSGRSLQGNIPKVIVAGPEAKIVRKWIKDLPPRALLCLLPNKVIVAYNPVDGSVLNAWHSAEINQTPSLPDRSQKPSEINGSQIPKSARPILKSPNTKFIAYESKGTAALIHSLVDGKPMTVTIAPEGESAFTIATH
ncbi:cytochrome c [Akkermansiaceae bacterium]|nr:cytochrome c [Akkermansiaceae bacterium]MDC1206821.1 cytochrome c [Akkermansiaceae bacterium]